ncbi:MAG: DUF3859 domain-containing protein [Gammaproteobacteria bacterium]|uniref:DUF3859 domain-containing protein n=1 Tax=hydrothermal vent metagenome TaxID=652676 RepID=A0A3B1A3Y3_9ZZZZ|nr:DUF3859 domain-containing protein [Gammaproteobacteria bacterium]MCF6259026.1 DUF3859 domain-containing protein [Gammaproteobacteria bacterium]
MKNTCFRVLGFVFLSAVMVTVQAAPQAKIIERGYYNFIDETERLASPLISSGYVKRGEAELVKDTQRIPLEMGRLFGFRFRISGIDKNIGVIPLELVVVHPEMKKSDGSSSSGYRYNIHLKLTNGMVEDQIGYSINEDFEMVEGDWQFEFLFMNKTLLKQAFTTYLQDK